METAAENGARVTYFVQRFSPFLAARIALHTHAGERECLHFNNLTHVSV